MNNAMPQRSRSLGGPKVDPPSEWEVGFARLWRHKDPVHPGSGSKHGDSDKRDSRDAQVVKTLYGRDGSSLTLHNEPGKPLISHEGSEETRKATVRLLEGLLGFDALCVGEVPERTESSLAGA